MPNLFKPNHITVLNSSREVSNMLRQISNYFKGRKLMDEKTIKLQDALYLLTFYGYYGHIVGNINGYIGTDFFSETCPLDDMREFVEYKFDDLDSPMYHTTIEHETYSKPGQEKHYLDIALGEVTGKFGDSYQMGTIFRKATIDFIVEAEK
jgi:hypothetical protein